MISKKSHSIQILFECSYEKKKNDFINEFFLSFLEFFADLSLANHEWIIQCFINIGQNLQTISNRH